jgi:hypothetical protein
MHFEISDVDGHWYWALVAGTGSTIARTKAFETKEALFHDIRRTLWWKIPTNRRDGLELIGPILATVYLVGLVLPTLILGLLGRWPPFAAVLGVVVVALASDTLWPWLPWQWLPGPPSW